MLSISAGYTEQPIEVRAVNVTMPRRQWPVMSDRVPWYPNLRVVGKDGRPWDTALDDAWSRVRTLLDG